MLCLVTVRHSMIMLCYARLQDEAAQTAGGVSAFSKELAHLHKPSKTCLRLACARLQTAFTARFHSCIAPHCVVSSKQLHHAINKVRSQNSKPASSA